MENNIKNDDAIKIVFRPDLENASDQNRFFSNFLSVSHDIFTFTLTFSDSHYESIKTKKENLKDKDENGSFIIKIPVAARIIVPGEFMPMIIKACQENYESFLKIRKEQRKV